MDSLGRPAESLIIRTFDRERPSGIYVKDIQRVESEEIKMSASEMLDTIVAEQGIVGAQRVAENIEDARLSWASKLQRKDKPTEVELQILARTLRDGFTTKQLVEYYGIEDLDLTNDPDNLDASYSTNRYTRTPWTYGTTTFPQSPDTRHASIKEAATARERKIESMPKRSSRLKNARPVQKTPLINDILRKRWRIRTVEDEEAVGEIDIWPLQEHLMVLLNHSKPSYILK